MNLLLTATITPHVDAKVLKILDPKIRLKQYLKSFKFYLNFLKIGKIDSIIFIENSGSCLESFRELVREYGIVDKVEFISSPESNVSGNRGVSEFNTIRYCIKSSKLLMNQSNAWIIKLSGRYIIKNFNKFLDMPFENLEMAFDVRSVNYKPLFNYEKKWVNTFMFFIRRDCYLSVLDGIVEDYLKLDYYQSVEHYFYDNLFLKYTFNKKYKFRFKYEARILNKIGLNNKEKSTVEYWFKSVMRLVIPKLWV